MINRPLFVSYGIYGAGSISLIFEAPESPIYLSIFSLAGECFWGVPKFVSQGAEVLKLRQLATRVNELENIRQFLTGTALTVVLDAVFSVVYRTHLTSCKT